ncbi:hypothetical protein [Paenochrobactrum pullorum]|uniref:hypothetical protein n=1 Tax=Paenochrobactrum pullorum TaxID=1324351 RepID=UPI0035BC571B
MTYSTKNYFTEGGDTLVVGGKLVIEEGAEVEGLEGDGGSSTAWADVTGKPEIFPPTVGTTATTASAGNHNHAVTADAASGLAAAVNLQAAFVALSARIKALEGAG